MRDLAFVNIKAMQLRYAHCGGNRHARLLILPCQFTVFNEFGRKPVYGYIVPCCMTALQFPQSCYNFAVVQEGFCVAVNRRWLLVDLHR